MNNESKVSLAVCAGVACVLAYAGFHVLDSSPRRERSVQDPGWGLTSQQSPSDSSSIDNKFVSFGPLLLNQPIGTYKQTLTESDTELLKSYRINGTRARQYLHFSAECGLRPIVSEFELIGDRNFLFCENGDKLFRYEIIFENGLESRLGPNASPAGVISRQTLTDLVNRRVNILGEDYQISDAQYSSDTGTVDIRLRSSNNGTIMFGISTGSHAQSPSGYGGVLFYIYEGSTYEELIEDAEVEIGATPLPNGNVKINHISVTLHGSFLGDDVYISVGSSFMHVITGPRGVLSDKWNVEYHGPRPDGTHDVRFVER